VPCAADALATFDEVMAAMSWSRDVPGRGD
jgi:hypothetical protein